MRLLGRGTAVVLIGIFLATAAQARPALWRLADDDTEIIMLGTIHLLQPGTTWLDGELETFLGSSDLAYFELSPDEQRPALIQQQVARFGLLQNGQTLSSLLPPEINTKMQSQITSLGVPAAAVDPFKPWLAAINLSVVSAQRLGYQPTSGVESRLAVLFQSEGVPVRGLETLAQQFSIFDSLDDATEVAFLNQTLDDLPKMADLMATMTSAWQRADLETLQGLITASLEKYPNLNKALLTDRNATWTRGLSEILRRETGRVLIAVGTGHFLGNNSLLAIARENGLTIQRFELDPDE